MAALSRSRRAGAGIAFLVAGALLALGILLGLAGLGVGPWPTVLAWIGVGVGFVILALGSVANLVARIALVAGAVGWFLLALDETGLGLPAALTLIGLLAASLGGVVGAIVLFTGKEITDRSAVAFIATTIVAAILLIGAVAGLPLAGLGLVLTLLFAAGLVITGGLLSRVQHGR